MNSIAKEIWEWAIQRNIHLTAVHIPGIENVKADFLSRHFLDQMEWQLNRHLFRRIVQTLFYPQVDLFAIRLNYQLPKYVSWQPDPMAYGRQMLSQYHGRISKFMLSLHST